MAIKLRPEFLALAIQIQEADQPLSSDDVAARLRDSIADKFRGSGDWGYFITYFGDAESGDVIYTHSQDTRRASYEISGIGDTAAKCVIDFDGSQNVVPRTIYEVEADDDDTYSQMEESFKAAKIYTSLPLYERFISKKERDSIADEDFAGKNRSYPIKTQADVDAAFHALGRAGSDNYSIGTIRANIIRIAKRKGFRLPKSAQKDAKESQASQETGSVKLKESFAFPVDLNLREAFGPSKRIKIIRPGEGSSAVYTAEVLKRDGPKVFKAGTPMRIDHPTRADEATRPEGSVKDWGAVLSEDAQWMEGHPEGPGLYAAIKPFSDSAQFIEERAPYAGVSIRATGTPAIENGRIKTQNGKPVLASIDSAEGVDMVTRAGAGGMFLSESASGDSTNSGEVTMDDKEVKRLIEAALAPVNARELKRDAINFGARVLESYPLKPEQKQFVLEEALRSEVPAKDGALDEEAFKAIVTSEAKRLAKVLGNSQIRGLGSAVLTEAGKMKNCPDCNGSGEDGDGDCDTCDGSGKVPAKKAAKESRVSEDEADKALAARLVKTFKMSESAALLTVKGRD